MRVDLLSHVSILASYVARLLLCGSGQRILRLDDVCRDVYMNGTGLHKLNVDNTFFLPVSCMYRLLHGASAAHSVAISTNVDNSTDK